MNIFKKIKNKRWPLIVSLLIVTFASSALYITKASVFSHELSFREYSVAGVSAGSVVPASCDSVPPTSHTSGDCPDTCNLNGIGATTQYDSAKNSCLCKNKSNDPPNCPTGLSTYFGNPPSAPVTTLTTDDATVPYGGRTIIRWSNTGSCTSCSSTVGYWNTGTLACSGSKYSPYMYAGTKVYGIKCNYNNGQVTSWGTEKTKSVTAESGDQYGGGCFVAGTQVLMGDGTYKNIEAVTLEDTIMTSGGPQEVMKAYRIKYKGLLYAFNGSDKYFVTPTHPFMTPDGWKSLDPEGTRKESKGIVVSQLTVGDTLIMKDGSVTELTSLDSIYGETMVYNFGVNGTHDFYADNYLVHNVDMGFLFEKAYAALK